MTGIVMPCTGSDGLKLLTSWLPEPLVPLAGKPFLDHQIEMFVRHGITRLIVVVSDRLYEVEEYFGAGERWGVSLKFILAPPDQTVSALLNQLAPLVTETPVVVISSFTNPSFPLDRMLDEFRRGNAPLLATADGAGVSFPLITGADTLTELAGKNIKIPDDFSTSTGAAQFTSEMVCREPSDLDGYLALSRAALRGELPGLIIPAMEQQPGIWIGRNCRIAPSARLTPPVVIGANCQIRDHADISGAVVCERVVIDSHAQVTDSVVMENTFVGSHTEVAGALVRKNGIIHVTRGVAVTVTDPIILADLTEAITVDQRQRFFDLIAAVTLIILFSPVLLIMFSLAVLLWPLKLVTRQRCYGNRETPTLSGNHLRKPFLITQFRFGPLLFRKLPGLVNVIKGDLAMVGAKPLSNVELAEITGKWQELRQDNIHGLFHVWEAEGDREASFEERLAMENFYAVTRNWRQDLKVLIRVRV